MRKWACNSILSVSLAVIASVPVLSWGNVENTTLLDLLSRPSEYANKTVSFSAYFCAELSGRAVFFTSEHCVDHFNELGIGLDLPKKYFYTREKYGHGRLVTVEGVFVPKKEKGAYLDAYNYGGYLEKTKLVGYPRFDENPKLAKITNSSESRKLKELVRTWMGFVLDKDLKKLAEVMGLGTAEELEKNSRAQWILFGAPRSAYNVIKQFSNPHIDSFSWRNERSDKDDLLICISRSGVNYQDYSRVPEVLESNEVICIRADYFKSKQKYFINPVDFGFY